MANISYSHHIEKRRRGNGSTAEVFITYKSDQKQSIAACHKLTDSIYEGLDVTSEIRSVAQQSLGETLLLWGATRSKRLAVWHCGEGSEPGRHTCFIKFAAAQPGTDAEKAFDRLLDACESLAAERGLLRLEAG